MSCAHCPIRGNLPCPGVSPGRRGYAVPRYCELAETDPRYHAVIVSEAEIDAGSPHPEPPLPGLLAQAKNFAAAMADHAANGFRLAPGSVQAKRLATCEACEWFRRSDRRCARCGCGLAAKAELASSECPVGKWGPV